MVKLPEPVQFELPVKVQVPVIVFPFTVPTRASAFPDGVPDCTVIPNLPLTLPLKSPLKANEPVSVSPDVKHDEFVLKLKFVKVTDPLLLLMLIVVPNANTGELLPLTRVAFQLPFTLLAFELLFEPHPTNARPAANRTAIANCFIRDPPSRNPKGA
jgi:hypothetical protein